MNLIKRGRIWWVRKMKAGVRHCISLRTESRTEARRIAEGLSVIAHSGGRDRALELVDALFPPEPGDGGRIAIASIWDDYIKVATATGRANVSETTLKKRHRVINRLVAWLSESAPAAKAADDVTGPVAARFATHLAASGASVKTRINLISDISTVWTMLTKVDAALDNPWRGLVPRMQAGDGNRREAFSRDQEEAVFAAAKKIGKDWPTVCLVARHTGLRYGDIAELKWGMIDMERGVITLNPSKTARHGVSVCLPMIDAVRDELASRGENHAPNEYVFPGHAACHENECGNNYNILNFREVLDAAGLGKEFTFHSWRHTFRSRLAEAGVPMETAKLLCGHTRDETSRHYDHSSHLTEYAAAIKAASAK